MAGIEQLLYGYDPSSQPLFQQPQAGTSLNSPVFVGGLPITLDHPGAFSIPWRYDDTQTPDEQLRQEDAGKMTIQKLHQLQMWMELMLGKYHPTPLPVRTAQDI